MQLPHAQGFRTFPARRPLVRAALAVFIFASLGIAAGFAVRTVTGDPATGPLQLSALVDEAPLIVYSEFGEDEDNIWAADPADPARRTQLAAIPHVLGYGIAPSLSPDSRSVAYTVAPPSGGPAELWLLDIEDAQARRLLSGVDLVSSPIWTSGGLIVRRSTGTEDGAGEAELLRVALSGEISTLVKSEDALYPIGAANGVLYYATLTAGGATELMRTSLAGGAPEPVARLSDGLARDWHLSPDATKLAYVAQGGGYLVRVLDLASGKPIEAAGASETPGYNPVWAPDGSLTIGRVEGAALRVSPAGAEELDAPQAGFDVPIDWAPDGEHLAARTFEGATAADPGPSRVVLIGAHGGRAQLSSLSDVTIAGWLTP